MQSTAFIIPIIAYYHTYPSSKAEITERSVRLTTDQNPKLSGTMIIN